jgi:hypothetical protein
MKKALTIIAASALALGAAACHKSEDSSTNVSSDDNMLVPADENAAGGDMNGAMADNAMGDNMMSDNSAMGNSSNAM